MSKPTGCELPKVWQPYIEELESRIDRLMLEYCPDEMTEEQKANWANNQRTVDEPDTSISDDQR